MEELKKYLKKQKIDFRIINSIGQNSMIQILRQNVDFEFKKECKKLGYKIQLIDSTALIFDK